MHVERSVRLVDCLKVEAAAISTSVVAGDLAVNMEWAYAAYCSKGLDLYSGFSPNDKARCHLIDILTSLTLRNPLEHRW